MNIHIPSPEEIHTDQQIVTLEEFTKIEDLFAISILYHDKEYVVDLSEAFTSLFADLGDIDRFKAERIIEFISAFRGELVKILDCLEKECDDLIGKQESFMAQAISQAEDEISKEREALIAQKLKKEIGMITQAQITNFIIMNHTKDYEFFRDRLAILRRNIKTLTRLDTVLSNKSYALNEQLNRLNKS